MNSTAANSALRILVIDDEPFVRAISVNQLHQLGYRNIETVSDGAEALGLLQNDAQPFGLILCDLNMPVMDGVDFIHAAQAINYRGALILLSSEDRQRLDETVELGIACGLNVLGALSKPLERDALQKMLRNYPAARDPGDRF